VSEHLVDIRTVRRLYADAAGKPDVGRNTVSDWLHRRGIQAFGGSEKDRRFDGAAVKAALHTDFPPVPRFIPAEDAFFLAGRPYNFSGRARE